MSPRWAFAHRAKLGRLATSLVAGLVVVHVPAQAQRCTGLDGAEPRPAWVDTDLNDHQALYASGSAQHGPGESAEVARSKALAAAMGHLAERLLIRVTATVEDQVSLRLSDGQSLRSEVFQALVRTSTELELSGLSRDAEWWDSANCRVHVRVRLQQHEVLRTLRSSESRTLFGLLTKWLRQAADERLPASERDAVLKAAAVQRSRIDAQLTPEYSPEATQVRLDALAGAVAEALRADGAYRAALAQ